MVWGEEVTSIPLVDLTAQHAAVESEIAEGWRRVLARTSFIGGPEVAAFESEYAAFIGLRHCVGTANGTDAIEIALTALGIGRGDECILPANTFIATAEAVYRAGATPVLVDCADDGTYLIDAEAVASAITSRTRAIIPVHMYGQAAPVERLLALAGRTGGWVVEDAAQSHGARRGGISAGALGHVAATSFYPGKNLGAYGDAGAVLTDSDELAARIRMIGNHGSRYKYEHEVIGLNSRLDSLQAVVLSAKLSRLARWNMERQAAAARYADLLSDCDAIVQPRTLDGNEHVWHVYAVRVPDRDRVHKELHAAGVDAGIHYPLPIHLTSAFAGLGYVEGAFPVAERNARELLSLPLFPGITVVQQERVVSVLTSVL